MVGPQCRPFAALSKGSTRPKKRLELLLFQVPQLTRATRGRAEGRAEAPCTTRIATTRKRSSNVASHSPYCCSGLQQGLPVPQRGRSAVAAAEQRFRGDSAWTRKAQRMNQQFLVTSAGILRQNKSPRTVPRPARRRRDVCAIADDHATDAESISAHRPPHTRRSP